MKESEKRYKRLKAANYSLVVGVLALFLFACSPAKAARPLITDDAGIVEDGAFELEIGHDFSQDEDHTRNQSLGISLKHGLMQRLDLGIGFPYEIKPENEFSNVEVGIKYLLLKEKANLPALSLTFACELGNSECVLTGITSKRISDLTVHFNLGYQVSANKGGDEMTVYAGAIEYVLNKKFTLVAELVAEAYAKENALEALVGGNYSISEQVVLDFAIGKGLSTESAKQGKATLGITCGF